MAIGLGRFNEQEYSDEAFAGLARSAARENPQAVDVLQRLKGQRTDPYIGGSGKVSDKLAVVVSAEASSDPI